MASPPADVVRSIAGVPKGTPTLGSMALIRHGPLRLKSTTGQKARHYFLFDKILLYTDPVTRGGTFKYKNFTELESAYVESVTKENNNTYTFVVVAPKKSYTLVADSMELKEGWMRDLRSVISHLVRMNPAAFALRRNAKDRVDSKRLTASMLSSSTSLAPGVSGRSRTASTPYGNKTPPRSDALGLSHGSAAMMAAADSSTGKAIGARSMPNIPRRAPEHTMVVSPRAGDSDSHDSISSSDESIEEGHVVWSDPNHRAELWTAPGAAKLPLSTVFLSESDDEASHGSSEASSGDPCEERLEIWTPPRPNVTS